MGRLSCFFLLLIYGFASGQYREIPAAPYPVAVVQGDGSVISVLGRGDEKLNFTVTTDGYTVLKNARGVFEYARQNSLGELVLSGIKARNPGERHFDDIQFLDRLPKFLRAQRSAPSYSVTAPDDSPQMAFPTSGNRRILLLLIRYPDLADTYTLSNFNNLMNQTNYNGTGSFSEYYQVVSQGKLNLTIDVFGWYTAKNNYEYYGDNNGSGRAQDLVAEAVDAAEAAGVNFALYDNDNNGTVDNLMVVHAGPGAEEGSLKQYIWSHSWSLNTKRRFYDGVYINPYIIQPETRRYGMVGIGVFCHEFGHALGLPDLYDTNPDNGDSEGLGNWCLMAGGSWLNNERTPATMSAWCKNKLGWLSPQLLSSTGNYSLAPAAASNDCYRINTPNTNEYFLLENRLKTGFDQYLPGSGMAIYHINTNRSDNSDATRKLVDLEEADGRNDLDNCVNRGDAGDVFPGSTQNRTFNDNTNPDAKTYDGKLTNINVSNITLSGNTIQFSFGVAAPVSPDLTYQAAQNSLTISEHIIDVSMTVKNQGDGASTSSRVGFYLSADQTITTSDHFLGYATVPALDPGASSARSFNVNALTQLPGLANGNYYVGYIVDYQNSVTESNESNNAFAFSTPLYSRSLNPNLTFVEAANQIEITDSQLNAWATITNAGNLKSGTTAIAWYLSPDPLVTTSDFLLAVFPVRELQPGENLPVAIQYYLSQLAGNINPGNYYVGYIVDYQNKVAESNEADNLFVFSSQLRYCPANQVVLNETICTGQTVVVNGIAHSTSGSYFYHLQNRWGCDSLVTLNLTVLPSFDVHIAWSICEGESFLLGNQILTTSGTYQHMFSGITGCDSLVTLNLIVRPAKEVQLAHSICQGNMVTVGDHQFSQPGQYIIRLTDSFGCDSTVVLSLNVNPVSETHLVETICEGGFVAVGQNLFSNSGSYAVVLANQWGCDSLVTLDLQVLESDMVVIDKTLCEGELSYIGDEAFSETGIYSRTFINRNGCDSTVILNLTVHPADRLFVETETCSSQPVYIGSKIFDQTGVYQVLMKNRFGCDSLVTLGLKVYPENDTLLVRHICFGDSVKLGEKWYSSSGIYSRLFRNRFGCDSLVTLELTVNPIQQLYMRQTICEGEVCEIGPDRVSSGGNYVYRFENQYGCDSIVNLHLTVIPRPLISLGDDQLLYASDKIELKAGQGFATYAWSTGETTPSIFYDRGRGLGLRTISVVATDQYGCIATDTVNVRMLDYSEPEEERLSIAIFPNPAKQFVNLIISHAQGEYLIELIRPGGSVAFAKTGHAGSEKNIVTFVTSQLTEGIYYIRVVNNGFNDVKKLVVIR